MRSDGRAPTDQQENSEGNPVWSKEVARTWPQRLVVISLLVILAIGCSLLGFRVLWDMQERRHVTMVERLEVMENELAGQESINLALANLQSNYEQLEVRALNLDENLDVLRQELASIRERQVGSHEWEVRYRRVAAQVDALRREVQLLREASSGQQFSVGGTLLLLARLRQNLLQGQSCAGQLEILRSLAREIEKLNDPLEILVSPCENGVLTRDELEHNFSAAVNQMVATLHISEDSSWRDRIQGMFRRLVTIRPVNPEENSQRPSAIMAKTEELLILGDLSGALATIGKLSRVSGKGADWINALEQHVTAIATIDRITEVLITETMEASVQNE